MKPLFLFFIITFNLAYAGAEQRFFDFESGSAHVSIIYSSCPDEEVCEIDELRGTEGMDKKHILGVEVKPEGQESVVKLLNYVPSFVIYVTRECAETVRAFLLSNNDLFTISFLEKNSSDDLSSCELRQNYGPESKLNGLTEGKYDPSLDEEE